MSNRFEKLAHIGINESNNILFAWKGKASTLNSPIDMTREELQFANNEVMHLRRSELKELLNQDYARYETRLRSLRMAYNHQ